MQLNHEEHNGVACREDNVCCVKLLTLLNDNERVVGLHYLGPNAGEITQVRAQASGACARCVAWGVGSSVPLRLCLKTGPLRFPFVSQGDVLRRSNQQLVDLSADTYEPI